MRRRLKKLSLGTVRSGLKQHVSINGYLETGKKQCIAVLMRELKCYSNCTLIRERNRFSKARFI